MGREPRRWCRGRRTGQATRSCRHTNWRSHAVLRLLAENLYRRRWEYSQKELSEFVHDASKSTAMYEENQYKTVPEWWVSEHNAQVASDPMMMVLFVPLTSTTTFVFCTTCAINFHPIFHSLAQLLSLSDSDSIKTRNLRLCNDIETIDNLLNPPSLCQR